MGAEIPHDRTQRVFADLTTRGDRLFIGLLSAAYVNLAFVGLSEKFVAWFHLDQEPSVWVSFVLSMALLALIMKKG